MIRHNVIQGSQEWHELRLGKPTASCFNQIVTPTGKLSAQADKYMHRLIAERILGYSLDAISTAAMETGREREPEAVQWYEFTHGIETDVVGIVFSDDGRIGASPDRVVGADGMLEIKCPMPHTHIGYLLDDVGHSDAYRPQVQGQLWIGEREWNDAVSYCPMFPASLVRRYRDDGYIAKLKDALAEFCDRLDAETERIRKMGEVPA